MTQSSNKNSITTQNSFSSERKRHKCPLSAARGAVVFTAINILLISFLSVNLRALLTPMKQLSDPKESRVADFRRNDWPSSIWMPFVLAKPVRRYKDLSILRRKPDFSMTTVSCGRGKVIRVFPNQRDCIQGIYIPSWFFVTLRILPRAKSGHCSDFTVSA